MQPVLALLPVVVLLLSISPDMVRADCQSPPTFESASIASVKYKCNSNPLAKSIQATCANGRWHFAGVNPLSCNCHASTKAGTKAGTKGFEGPSTEARLVNCTTFCQDAGDVILVPVGDVDGDGYQDLVCHKSTGLIHVALNTKQGGFIFESTPAGGIPKGWCKGQKQEVFIGDFDGDRRADLLCHSYQTGSKDVRLRKWTARPQGVLHRQHRCPHAKIPLDRLQRRWQGRSVLPQDRFGTKQLRSYRQSRGFSAGQPCAWQSKDDYCNQNGDLLIFGRFFGTKRDDLLCIRGKTYLLRRNYGL